MTLHVVLHHHQDPNQPWTNDWVDDERIQSIQTTTEIGRLCQDAQRRNDAVFVHRCAWGGNSPIICCCAMVTRVATIDRRTALVTFEGATALGLTPPVQAFLGQNFYIV